MRTWQERDDARPIWRSFSGFVGFVYSLISVFILLTIIGIV